MPKNFIQQCRDLGRGDFVDGRNMAAYMIGKEYGSRQGIALIAHQYVSGKISKGDALSMAYIVAHYGCWKKDYINAVSQYWHECVKAAELEL